MLLPVFSPRLMPEKTRSGFFFHNGADSQFDAVGGGAAGRIAEEFAAAADFGYPQRVGQGYRVSNRAALGIRRHYGDIAGLSQRIIKGEDALGVDAVVVGYKYFHLVGSCLSCSPARYPS